MGLTGFLIGGVSGAIIGELVGVPLAKKMDY